MAAGVIPRAPNTPFNAERKALFCEHYAKTCLMHESASVAGVDYWTVRAHMKKDPQFLDAIKVAKAQHVETIEKAIHTRGVVGWYDEVVTKDKQTGIETSRSRSFKASDKLLLAYAKRHSKAYRNPDPAPNLSQITVNTQVNVNFEAMDAGQRASLRAFLEAVKAKPLPAVETIVPVADAEPANGHANGTNGHAP